MADVALTVHFSCMAIFSKPGHFSSDYDLMSTVYTRGKSCSRFYYMTWVRRARARARAGGKASLAHPAPAAPPAAQYEKFSRAMAPFQRGLREPFWEGPPVPLHNKTHDALVEVWKAERQERERKESGGG